jgi:hypothetical protein
MDVAVSVFQVVGGFLPESTGHGTLSGPCLASQFKIQTNGDTQRHEFRAVPIRLSTALCPMGLVCFQTEPLKLGQLAGGLVMTAKLLIGPPEQVVRSAVLRVQPGCCLEQRQCGAGSPLIKPELPEQQA